MTLLLITQKQPVGGSSELVVVKRCLVFAHGGQALYYNLCMRRGMINHFSNIMIYFDSQYAVNCIMCDGVMNHPFRDHITLENSFFYNWHVQMFHTSRKYNQVESSLARKGHELPQQFCNTLQKPQNMGCYKTHMFREAPKNIHS